MIGALLLAIGDLGDRRVLAVLGRSLLVTLAIFAALGGALAWLLSGTDPCAALDLGECPLGGAAGGVGALALTALGLWFLFPVVAIGVVSAYTDDIVAAVEARHYPAAAAGARRLGIAGGALMGVRDSLRLLVYNLVALPLYVVLLVTGIGTVVLFALVNGLALGRDLGGMVAARHADSAGRRAWLRATRALRAGIGVAIAALLLVPFANLVAPMLGAAAMTHLYHRGRAPRG